MYTLQMAESYMLVCMVRMKIKLSGASLRNWVKFHPNLRESPDDIQWKINTSW